MHVSQIMERDFGRNDHLVDIQWNTLDTSVKSACHGGMFSYIIQSSSETQSPGTETDQSV